MSKKSFCGGLICKKTDRKFMCSCCDVWVCGSCKAMYRNFNFCIDCYVGLILNKEINIFKKKKIKKEKIILPNKVFINNKVQIID